MSTSDETAARVVGVVTAAANTTISLDVFLAAPVLVHNEPYETTKKEEDEADSNERAFDFGD